MVKHHRYNSIWKRHEESLADEDEELQNCENLLCENSYYNTKTQPKLILLYSLFLCLVSCCFFILAYQFLTSSSILYSFIGENGGLNDSGKDLNASLCSFVSTGTICCDRSSIRSDICIMKGDVRTDSASSSVFLYSDRFTESDDGIEDVIRREKIRPYTRKWETSVMNSIDELSLVVKKGSLNNHQTCDVEHDVPAVFFSTGGYTGNVYHEFNDGIIPLYITSQRFNRKVVLVILEYHNWWITKYGDILSQLTDYPVIDFGKDRRVHCFPEAIVGLRIHDELAIDSSLMEENTSIRDFRDILDRGYWPRIRGLIQEEERIRQLNVTQASQKPKLVILSRNGSRAITNEDALARLAEGVGFEVEIFRPDRTSELAKIYRVLNASDVMIGVHGAAMTHFLFMKPGSVFIQVIPLGLDWAAETYYGKPATGLGLSYFGYKVLPRESSLYDEYDKNDPVLVDPTTVNKRGWEFTKKIYLDRQNVRLDLRRFQKHLLRAYSYTVGKNGMPFRLRHNNQGRA